VIFSKDHSAKQIIFLHDLYGLLEKVIDRCRDAGNIIVQVALKYSVANRPRAHAHFGHSGRCHFRIQQWLPRRGKRDRNRRLDASTTPRQAIAMAAFFNFTGALVGGAVASTIGKGLVDTEVVTMTTVLCAVIAAFSWNIATWWLGLPSSSSHALIGGLCGAALAAARAIGQ
jgi:Phosphate/sulphate permeases